MKYFVSYTTRDKEITLSFLESFSLSLKRIGEVFVDLIDNNSKDKQARVMSELDNSDFLILIETESTHMSDWVSIEIERAKSKNIPIRIMKFEDVKQLSPNDFFDSIHSLTNCPAASNNYKPYNS